MAGFLCILGWPATCFVVLGGFKLQLFCHLASSSGKMTRISSYPASFSLRQGLTVYPWLAFSSQLHLSLLSSATMPGLIFILRHGSCFQAYATIPRLVSSLKRKFSKLYSPTTNIVDLCPLDFGFLQILHLVGNKIDQREIEALEADSLS